MLAATSGARPGRFGSLLPVTASNLTVDGGGMTNLEKNMEQVTSDHTTPLRGGGAQPAFRRRLAAKTLWRRESNGVVRAFRLQAHEHVM